MIFKDELCDKVLDGSKTQTRRLVKDGDYLMWWPMPCVFNRNDRLRFREAQTYAVQPGRGKHAVGRIGIAKIRREPLNAITHDDAQAEGVGRSIAAFADLWTAYTPRASAGRTIPRCGCLSLS